MRILLGSSYYEDWQNEHTFVERDPLGNRVDQRHPWNQTTIPAPQRRDFSGKLQLGDEPSLVPRARGDHLALDTGGGPIASLWSTALSGLVDTPYVQATGHSVTIDLPRTPAMPEMHLEWKIPQWSNALERDRARVYFVAYAAAMAMFFYEQAMGEIRAGRTREGMPIFEENGPESFKGIDIMRAVRSFDPCLPCGVHMYLGKGRITRRTHSPFGSGL